MSGLPLLGDFVEHGRKYSDYRSNYLSALLKMRLSLVPKGGADGGPLAPLKASPRPRHQIPGDALALVALDVDRCQVDVGERIGQCVCTVR